MSSILDHQLSVRPRSVDVLPPKLHLGRLLQPIPSPIDACLRPATVVPNRGACERVGDVLSGTKEGQLKCLEWKANHKVKAATRTS